VRNDGTSACHDRCGKDVFVIWIWKAVGAI
jgi:hypothetical protein